jgi:serine/threonine-protein kinase
VIHCISRPARKAGIAKEIASGLRVVPPAVDPLVHSRTVGGEAEVGRELAWRLEEALARFGIAGNIAVDAGMATLHGNGPTVSTDVGSLVREWALLAEDARSRQVTAVARRLSSERRAAAALAASQSKLPEWVRPLALVLLAVLAGIGLIRGSEYWAARRSPSAGVTKDYDAYERERAARAARACEATRSRILRGAAVGPGDAEGWVVELWALRPPDRPSPALDPALAAFVTTGEGAKGRLVWTGAHLLKGRDGPDTTVEVTEANLPETSTPAMRGLRLTFTGRLVAPYFEDGARIEYERFARALTDALGADYAALYAHCAGNGTHHLGTWFRGPTPGGATASLVYFMGAFGERPELRRSLLVPENATSPDPWYALQNVLRSTRSLKKARIMTLISGELGMIAGLDDHVSTITFPFRDANRAARAVHTIVRELGISEQQ